MMSPAEAFNTKPGNGKHVVLVVDDELAMREFLALYLRSKNFQVLVAADAAEATEVWNANLGRIDLIVTDIIMPGMNGKVMVDSFLAQCPDLKVIFMSGFLPHDLREEDLPFKIFKKPFHPTELLQAIRQELH